MGNHPFKILLVQLFANGDCLYATTIARQIKKDYPGCTLSWLIAEHCKNIIYNNPDVDEVITETNVGRNDVTHYKELLQRLKEEEKEGKWDKVFVTHNMYDNLALYDGTIRGMIFRAYPGEITVPVQPVLVLTPEEKDKVHNFALQHHLEKYSNVILWEYAPQSGQSTLNFSLVKKIAERITALPSTIVILSSAHAFESTEKIADASVLTVRENAALTHYCNLLIGCSSGITWLTTSTAARFLPMVQLLNPDAMFLNAASEDFNRYGIDSNGLIEITTLSEDNIYSCIEKIIRENFDTARQQYHQKIPLQFNTTRQIVYNMLCYRQFAEIKKHYEIMVSVYGRHPLFLKQFRLAFAGFPFKLLRNIVVKKLLAKK